ncbi:MAG: hypothetical protein KGK11_08600, partial [Sphingomonadales bacterium]|nr:hypothetical protein [Sphingomonadales bacterium]
PREASPPREEHTAARESHPPRQHQPRRVPSTSPAKGLAVLALTVVRIAWRLVNPPPPCLEGMHGREKHTAAFTHVCSMR